MKNSSVLVVVALLAGGGWFFLQNFDIEGWEQIKIKKKPGGATFPISVGGEEVPAHQSGETITIASFNIQVFGQSKLNKPRVMNTLASIVREFDVIAIQEIRSRDQDVLPRFIELINSAERSYDFIIGPRIGDSSSKEQYAYIFDRETIEVDRAFTYTVNDPDNLLHREPLVGWFRTRGPDEDEAFTFTLINVHTDPDIVATEMSVMDDVFRVVREYGDGEDDVIVLGDFNADDQHLGELGQVPGITWAIAGVPTNVRRTKQYDNIVFHRDATREFVGRSGVVDFMRDYNLSSDEALEVSDHLPVWAEFSIYEGGTTGYVAALPER